MTPELVRMYFAVKIDTPDTDTAAMHPAAIPSEQIQHLFRLLRIFLEKLQVQINTVNMIINR